MALWTIFGIAIGLAMDAMVVSIASGIYISKIDRGHIFRLAFHFGLFQALMPVIGWFIGKSFAHYIVAYDHWVAFALLTLIGSKMGFDALKNESQSLPDDPSRGGLLITLAVATSIDALAVGLSIAMLNESIILPAIIIGLVTGFLCVLGVVFGNRIGDKWQRASGVLGACILIGIGIKILVSHLT